MTTTYHLTLKSGNAKTGPIPVSTTSADTCPDACAFKANSSCYAKNGPLGIHWRAVDAGRGSTLDALCRAVASFLPGQLWRHNQAGDLPGTNEAIDHIALGQLIRANHGKRGFTYTHKPLTRENRACIRGANKAGFTVNVSTDSVHDADRAIAAEVGPVVVVVPSDVTANFKTPNGATVVICPATQRDNVTCASCRLCAWSERKVVIAFPAHGARKGTVDKLIQLGQGQGQGVTA